MSTPSSPTTSTSEKDILQEQTRLTRTIEAALKVAIPDPEEIRFRTTLLACAAEKLSALKPAFVTRLYEAACDVKFPSDEVTQFRKQLQLVIARFLSLRQYRK
jgi:hypothetical protein